MTTLLGARSDVIFRRREVYARSGPVCLSTSYLIADPADDIRFSWPDLEPGGRYACLAGSGRPLMIARAVTERNPHDREAAFLLLDGQRVHACIQITCHPHRRMLEPACTPSPPAGGTC